MTQAFYLLLVGYNINNPLKSFAILVYFVEQLIFRGLSKYKDFHAAMLNSIYADLSAIAAVFDGISQSK